MNPLPPDERAALAALLESATASLWSGLEAHPAIRRRPNFASGAIDRLLDYLETLLLWRTKTSLVATESPRDLVVHHIVDSLAIAPFVAPETRVADIGSGAGLPGLPLAIVCSDAAFLLVEPRRKRASFLREAVRVAAATNVIVAEARVEDLAADRASGSDLIVSRAFGPLPEFFRAVRPLVIQGEAGCRVLVMKGPRGEDEAAQIAADFGTPELVHYDLPGRDERVLLLYPHSRFT